MVPHNRKTSLGTIPRWPSAWPDCGNCVRPSFGRLERCANPVQGPLRPGGCTAVLVTAKRICLATLRTPPPALGATRTSFFGRRIRSQQHLFFQPWPGRRSGSAGGPPPAFVLADRDSFLLLGVRQLPSARVKNLRCFPDSNRSDRLGAHATCASDSRSWHTAKGHTPQKRFGQAKRHELPLPEIAKSCRNQPFTRFNRTLRENLYR
jgi:hypothetical protein